MTAGTAALAGHLVDLELLDQVRHRRKEDRLTRLASLDGKRHRKMGLAHARRSQEQDVLMARQKGEVEERIDLASVQVRLKGEVEVIDRLYERQARDLERGLQAPLLLAGDLLLQQGVQHLL